MRRLTLNTALFFASKTPLQLIASPVSYWAPTLSFSIVARGGACVLVFPAQLVRSVPVGLDSFSFFLGGNLQGSWSRFGGNCLEINCALWHLEEGNVTGWQSAAWSG